MKTAKRPRGQPGRPQAPLPAGGRNILVKLAAAVRTRRNSLGLTVDEAARRSGCDRATWYRIENGEIDVPLTRLQAVCKTLDIAWVEFARD
jgi:transcriptional regulator with XRE-family HTH domain